MPTYEYNCSKCGYRFERLQSIKAPTLRKCPNCGRTTLRRLIGTGAGLIFKGSGFYATDYRSRDYKEAAKKDTPEKDKGEKKETVTPATKAPEQKIKGKSKK